MAVFDKLEGTTKFDLTYIPSDKDILNFLKSLVFMLPLNV